MTSLMQRRQQTAACFGAALEDALGDALEDANLVWLCYLVYQKLFQQYADYPSPWPVAPTEQVLVEQWEAVKLTATQPAFGLNRYLDDADFEILAPSTAQG